MGVSSVRFLGHLVGDTSPNRSRDCLIGVRGRGTEGDSADGKRERGAGARQPCQFGADSVQGGSPATLPASQCVGCWAKCVSGVLVQRWETDVPGPLRDADGHEGRSIVRDSEFEDEALVRGRFVVCEKGGVGLWLDGRLPHTSQIAALARRFRLGAATC